MPVLEWEVKMCGQIIYFSKRFFLHFLIFLYINKYSQHLDIYRQNLNQTLNVIRIDSIRWDDGEFTRIVLPLLQGNGRYMEEQKIWKRSCTNKRRWKTIRWKINIQSSSLNFVLCFLFSLWFLSFYWVVLAMPFLYNLMTNDFFFKFPHRRKKSYSLSYIPLKFF